jgi:5'-phosphate synthase pdxT subunit
VFGTAFHPELTGDERIHAWWLGEVVKASRELS